MHLARSFGASALHVSECSCRGPWPTTVDFSATPELTAQLMRAFIDSRLQRLHALAYEVDSCLIDCADTAAVGLARSLEARRYDA